MGSTTYARRCAADERPAETGIARPGCNAPFVRRVEDQPMMTIQRRARRDMVPTDEVCTAFAGPSTSSAEPQTRLFWA